MRIKKTLKEEKNMVVFLKEFWLIINLMLDKEVDNLSKTLRISMILTISRQLCKLDRLANKINHLSNLLLLKCIRIICQCLLN
jgi:hypothetical protein